MSESVQRPAGAKTHQTTVSMEHRPVIQQGMVRAHDGTQLFYCSEGEGPPLVFIYGLACSSLHWTYQIEHFRKNYRCIWMDLRGHNASEVPKDLDTLNVTQMALDLSEVLNHLEIKEAVFLGHSMGVNILIEYALMRPETLKGLVLANGTARRPFETIFRTNLTELAFRGFAQIHRFLPRVVEMAWNAQKSSMIAKRLIGFGGFNTRLSSPKDIDVYVRKVAEMNPKIFLSMVKHYEDYDATPYLHRIEAPTMIISGTKDLITPSEQQELIAQLMPHGRLERVPQGSHCTQLDLPELVNFKIRSFLDDLKWKPANP